MSKLDTKIVAVTVYPDRARVTRRGTIKLEPGVHRLEIPELTPHLDPDSARLAASGTARARLGGTQVQRVHYAETPAEEVRGLEAQVEALKDELGGLGAQIAARKALRTRLDQVAGHSELFATSLAATEMDVETQLGMFDRLYQRAGELDAEILGLEADTRARAGRLEQLEKQLEALRSARPRLRYAAFVELEVEAAGELDVSLSYVVGRAAWKPLYDLRLSERGGAPSLEIGYLAGVTQQTGEDWEDISLSLSTARPALAATLPELEPWYIQPLAPLPRRPAAQPAAPLAMAAPAEASDQVRAFAAKAEIQEARVVAAEVETSGAAVTYHIPGALSIPPDGAAHKATVARFDLPPDLDYVAAPRLVEAAYRRARVVNASPHTLLPGAANLFAGDEFIGATRLELTAPGGEITLYLGADDRLKVARELARREVDKRLIGGKRRLRYAYEIRLENALPHAVQIEVHDQFPVSRHEEIKVRLESAQPAPDEHSELNLLEWSLRLEPGGKAALRYDFSVEHPPEMTVAGLV